MVGVSWALSLALIGLLYAIEPAAVSMGRNAMASVMPGWVLAAIMLGTALLLWGVLRWTYSFGAKIQVKAQRYARIVTSAAFV